MTPKCRCIAAAPAGLKELIEKSRLEAGKPRISSMLAEIPHVVKTGYEPMRLVTRFFLDLVKAKLAT